MGLTNRIALEKFSNEEQPRCYIPRRYIFTFLSFLGMVSVYAMRANLSVAIVAMVKSSTSHYTNNTNSSGECPNLIRRKFGNETEAFIGEQYNWDSATQGDILGAFFYGYIVTQLAGGYLAERFGSKWVFGAGVLILSVLTLVTPIAASWSAAALIAVRVLEGLGTGILLPSMNFMMSRWAPRLERSMMSTLIFTGVQIGTVASMPITGFLSSSHFLGGWPSAFYVFGAIGCVWFLFWSMLVYETPADHPSISMKELKMFMGDKDEAPRKKPKLPWKSVFTSMPMWAVIVAHFGHNFGFLIILTEMPTYLSSILHFNIKDNGLLSALPYVAQAATAWVASYAADRLRRSGRLSVTHIRKIWNSIGTYGPAICLLGVTLAGCQPQLTVIFLTLAMAVNGFIFSGHNVTHVDMCPAFAGILFGISNTIANCSGFLGPRIVSAFTKQGKTIENWSYVFYIAAAIYCIAATFYLVFASAEPQPWSEGEEEKPKEAIIVTSITIIDTKL